MISDRRFLVVLTATAVLIGGWLLATRASSDPQPPKSEALSVAASNASASQSQSDPVLTKEIDRIIAESNSAHARWGVFVASTKDGRVLSSRDGDRLFTPASNMKIFTTAVALDVLGADYRWRTSVYSVRQMDANGVVEGDLTLYGRGAPDFDSKAKGGLPALVDRLYERGLRRVRGSVVGDESYFRAETHAVGWQWNDLQWYYGAEPSALTIDENSVEVTIAPAKKGGSAASVVVNPDDKYVRLINNTTTGERDAITSVGIQRGLSNNDLQVWGEFPASGRSFSAFLSVHDPALYAATILKRLLTARGIQVDGDARSRDFRVAEADRLDPETAVELANTVSAPLSEIVRETNKESNNLFAELLFCTVGKERGATVPDPDPRRNATRGDDAAGAAVVKKWLSDHGVVVRDLAIHDGSGLSRLDLITPESAVRLLIAIAKSPSAASFRSSLPIAGRDGTLRGRLMPHAGKVSAKTGYLTYTHALSGYVTTANGEELAFSIICNDATGQSRAGRTIDAIVTLLAQQGPQKLAK
ncbi:MAG TPA: D-alanyl-D-alanine carboxypeptidase/D-alanyl-D-alanine-endopeptidase [Pyrinomonadaceae bacterium]|nr:D-alanyl-D-alanine carboxypeptidase/D-alanyl-D-alanine-endopeptidase [Pyrinomonadaceae bacterium]